MDIFQKMALCVDEVQQGTQVEIKCKLGLWSVTGDPFEAYAEALHYFAQYMGDGEYSSILGPVAD